MEKVHEALDKEKAVYEIDHANHKELVKH